MRDVDLLRNRVFRAVDQVEFARARQVALHGAVELGPGFILDPFDHQRRERAVGLQRQPPLHDRILVHPKRAGAFGEGSVDQQAVERRLHALRARGERDALLRRDSRQLGVPVGAGEDDLGSAHQDIGGGRRAGTPGERRGSQCGEDATDECGCHDGVMIESDCGRHTPSEELRAASEPRPLG